MSRRSHPSVPLFFLSLFLVSSSFRPSFAGDDKPTAYEVLESYDFPVGLLPKGALGYDLNPSAGAFSAYLNGSCSFSLEGSYQLRYSSTISGRISTDLLSNLRGISVKVLLFWVNIIEVRRLGDTLRFSVGIASADFAVDNFNISPRCGCGLDCPDDDDGGNAARFHLRLPRFLGDAVSIAEIYCENSCLQGYCALKIDPTRKSDMSVSRVHGLNEIQVSVCGGGVTVLVEVDRLKLTGYIKLIGDDKLFSTSFFSAQELSTNSNPV